MTDNDFPEASGPAQPGDGSSPVPPAAPSNDLRGPIRGSYLIRVTVHEAPQTWQGPVPELPGLRDVDDLIRFQFEALTGCPVGVRSERVDK